MPFVHGKAASATVNGTVLRNFSDNLSFSLDVDTSETSVFGATYKTSVVGQVQGTFELSGHYDRVAGGPSAVLTPLIGVDAPFACLVHPGGNTTGQVQHSFNAILTNYAETSAVGDKVSFSASFITTGAVTTTTVA